MKKNMKNTRRFTKHCKKITLSGNVKFDHRMAHAPYSRYVGYKKREDVTRAEFIDSYFMVTDLINDSEPLIINVDGIHLQLIEREDGTYIFMDTNTGEVMFVLNWGYVEYATDWVNEPYQWCR